MAKMGDYPELDTKYPPSTQGTKNTAFKNSANVLVTGEATSGSKEQLNIPLSQIQGDKLPSGGSTGQVIKKTANGIEWGDEKTELPTGGNAGDVLAKTSSGVAWQAPSGGGGAAYTKVTKTATYDSGRYTMKTSVDNNAYNVVSTAINQSATDLEISLTQTDLPDTFVEIKTNQSGYTSNLTSVKVKNGSTQLKRIFPAGVLQGENLWSTSTVMSTGYGDITAWNEVFSAKETILVRIQGSTFIVYFTGSTMEASEGSLS